MRCARGDPPVLHVSSEIGWRGGERQLMLLVAGAVALGLDHAVAAPAGSALVERAEAAGLGVIELPSRRPWHPRALFRLVDWLRRRERPVLHAHTSPALDGAPLLRRLTPLAGVVYTRRTSFPVRPARKYRTGANRYVAVARSVAEQLVAAGSPADRVAVIPSAVDLEELDAAGDTDPLEIGAGPKVGCVGALAPEKGQAVMIAAWDVVLAAVPDVRLVVVGDGPQRGQLEELARRLPPGSVRFAGFRNDVASCLKSLDLVVVPSLAEGVGGVAIEAMACRRPVVASRVGGLPEVIADGVTGLLVPPGDAAALADAVIALLGDPGRRVRMGEAGRARVEASFTAERMVASYLEIYRGLSEG